MDDLLFLNKLKNSILLKTGIRTITPHDCKLIALDIKRKTKTKGHISETTIKRLYGFASTNYKFSKFTISTLLAYTQGELAEQILEPEADLTNTPIDWKVLNNSATKVSCKTISNIKSFQSIPYALTISRKFAEHDFGEFFKSKQTFSAYIAQPGYGKTITMNHLAEHILNDSENYQFSSLIFLQIQTIFNSELPSFDLEQQIKLRLGIRSSRSLIECADENYLRTDGKLIVMLDGFSNLSLKSDAKLRLFEGIISFISSIEDSNSVKLVMSMRNTTWVKFYGRIAQSAYLKTKWFPGVYFNPSDMTNVPLLTDRELDSILLKNETLKGTVTNSRLKTLLKQPLQIQFYYQLKEENPDLNYVTSIVAYELVTRFVAEKIYKSAQYTEKVIFLNHIIQLTDYAKRGTCITKDSMADKLVGGIKIYNELVSEGILLEEKSYHDFHPKEYVHFANSDIFEYFLFVELQSKFEFKIDQSFFNHIKQEYNCNHLAFQLLQWTTRFIVRTSDFDALNLLFQFELNDSDKRYLLLSVVENLDYKARLNNETKKLLRRHNVHECIIKVITGLDFIDPNVKRSIELLINLTDDDEHLCTYYSLLLTFDILHLDTKNIKIRLKLLSRLRVDWPISPVQIGMAIHAKLIGRPKALNYLLKDIEQSARAASLPALNSYPSHSVSYLLLLLSAFFFSEKANAFTLSKLSSVRCLLPNIRSNPFSILLISLQGYIIARLSQGPKTDQLGNILIALKNSGSLIQHSAYSEFVIDIIEVLQHKKAGNYSAAVAKCLECMAYLEKNKLYFNQLLTYNLLIEIYEQVGDHIHVNEYSYKRLCFLEEHKILNNVFSSIF